MKQRIIKLKTLKQKKEAIIKFMEWKGREILRNIKVRGYFYKRDATDIRKNMTAVDADNFILGLFPYFDFGDSGICAFCKMYSCDECGYAKRHGECGEFGDNKYDEIIGNDVEGIVEIIGRDKLKKKILKLFPCELVEL